MKVGIVGSGFVGATAAYALVMQGVGREVGGAAGTQQFFVGRLDASIVHGSIDA